jgi:hypothetical protein
MIIKTEDGNFQITLNRIISKIFLAVQLYIKTKFMYYLSSDYYKMLSVGHDIYEWLTLFPHGQ